jgi:O-antigen/teichoic acid export membrane protein
LIKSKPYNLTSNNTREIKDVFYLIALQGMNYVMPLVVYPYLMIVLGAEKFGYIGFSMSITQYLMLIVDFGFNFSATKQIAIHKNNPQKLREIFWSTLFAKVGLLMVSFILLVIFSFGVPPFQIYRSTMFVFFTMVIGNTFSFVWYFQGLGKIRFVSMITVVSKLLILPLTFILVKSPDDLGIAASVQAGVFVLSSLISIGVLKRHNDFPSWYRPTVNQLSAEIKSSYPIFLSSVATSFYTALFAVILGFFSTPEEVGKYAAAEKIMRAFCYLIFMPVSQAFFPKISALSQTSTPKAVKLVGKIAYLVAALMVVVFMLLYFLSGCITSFLGNDYQGLDTLFKIMAAIPLLVALGGIAGQLGLLAVGGEKEKKKFQYAYFIAGVVALIIILLLVPKYTSVGASIALLVTEFIVFALMFRQWKRISRVIVSLSD